MPARVMSRWLLPYQTTTDMKTACCCEGCIQVADSRSSRCCAAAAVLDAAAVCSHANTSCLNGCCYWLQYNLIFTLRPSVLTIEASLTILTPFDSVVTSVGGGSSEACSPSTACTPGRGCVSGVLILLGPLGSHEGNVALLEALLLSTRRA